MASAPKKNAFVALLCLLFVSVFTASAQMPVTVAPQLLPPYSLKISDYYQGISPRLLVTLINNDFNRPGLRVRLRMTLKGLSGGSQLQTLPGAPLPVVTLNSGSPLQLSLSDLQPYFNPDNLLFSGINRNDYQQQGALPEDLYEFCFEAFEAVTGEKLSSGGCASAYIMLSDPPLLNMPLTASEVKITEPANIVFNWTPRHRSTAAYPSTYIFQIIEIYNPGTLQPGTPIQVDPKAAFNQQRVLYEEKTTSTSIVYGPTAPLLIPGKLYAWRVQASIDGGDQSIFRNGGFSEVAYFTATTFCPPVTNMVAYSTPGVLNLTWGEATAGALYTIYYRKLNEKETWREATTSANTIQIPDLERGATYEYKVSFGCGISNIAVQSVVQTIEIADQINIRGRVQWSLPLAAEQNRVTGPYTYITNRPARRRTFLALESTAPGLNTYPLKEGKMMLEFSAGGKILDSIRLATDANGRYRTEVPASVYAALGGNLTGLSVTASAGIPNHASIVSTTIPVVAGGKSSNTVDLMVVLNVMEAQLSGYSRVPLSNQQQAGVVMDVFIPQDARRGIPFWDQLFPGKQDLISYNGENYLKIESRNEARPVRNLPKLMSGYYLVRITFGNSVTYHVLNDDYNGVTPLLTWQKDPASRLVVFENYDVGPARELKGIVAYNGNPQGGITVLLQALRNGIVEAVVPATTDSNGRYEISFPYVGDESDVTWTVQVRDGSQKLNNLNAPDRQLQSVAPVGTRQENFDFDFRMRTIVGQFVDRDGSPREGVRVQFSGQGNASYGNVLTTVDGIYAVSVPSKLAMLRMQAEADDYESVEKLLNLPPLGQTVLLAGDWEKQIKTTNLIQKIFGGSVADVTPLMAGFTGGTTWEDAHAAIADDENPIVGVLDVGQITMIPTKGTARFRLVFARGNGSATIISPDSVTERLAAHNEVVEMDLPFGQQTVRVVPVAGGTPFNEMEVTVAFSLLDTAVKVIPIADFVRLTGTVTTPPNTPLEGVQLVLNGINVPAFSDAAGRYTLNLPRNQPYTLTATLRGYRSFTKSLQANADAVQNITLTTQPDIPLVTKLGGYDVTILSIARKDGTDDKLLISGSLVPPANAVFAMRTATEKLNFQNVEVQIDSVAKNAYPVADLFFQETLINLQAFGFAPVVMENPAGIMMKGMPGAGGQPNRKVGAITAGTLDLKLATLHNVSKLDLNLSNAKMRNKTAPAGETTELVFVPTGTAGSPLPSSRIYKLTFGGAATGGFIKSKLATYIPVSISQNDCELDNLGLTLKGHLEVPAIPGLKMMKSPAHIIFKDFLLSKTFGIRGLTLDVAANKPVELGIQRIRGKITEVILRNVGTANVGLSFAGTVYMKKPVAGGQADTAFIKKFDFLRQNGSTSVAGNFRLGAKGIGIKGLSYNMATTDELVFAYNSFENDFKFAGSGTLKYQSSGTATAGTFSSSLFPIAIQQFNFGTKNWSFFLAAVPNASVNLKVATIRLDKLVVSIGSTGMNKQALLTALTSAQMSSPSVAFAGGAEDLVDENNASWAVGFKGFLGFDADLKGLKADLAATMLIANINNSVSVDINELALNINQAAFTLAVNVKLLMSGPKVGFEGTGEMTVMKKGFSAAFKYYKLTQGTASGTEMGASFFLNTPIITGPVQWYKIGGGFDFNTLEKTFSVYAGGDLGAPGTPKEVMYLRDNTVKLSFNLAQCAGWPVFDLSGKLNVDSADWLTVTMKVDFCKSLLLITMNGSIPIIPAASVNVSGVLFGAVKNAGTATASSQVFFGLAASVNILSGMLQGNAFVGMGIKYNNNDPQSPPEAKAMWSLVDDEVKERGNTYFNGINVSCTKTLKVSNSLSIGGGGISIITASYSLDVSQQVKVYFRFTDAAFSIKLAGSLDVAMQASFLGFGLGGRAYANFNIGGGYNKGWRVAGGVGIGLELYNKANMSCNSWDVGWNSNGGVCGNVPYPCRCSYVVYCDICYKRTCTGAPTNSFKFCVNKNVSFSYVQGSPLKISL